MNRSPGAGDGRRGPVNRTEPVTGFRLPVTGFRVRARVTGSVTGDGFWAPCRGQGQGAYRVAPGPDRPNERFRESSFVFVSAVVIQQ